jgi:prepilin-type N-terminal cleavage/methylation domain-containing protein
MRSARITAGFSLIEVLCAILILGVGLVGLTEGITGALRAGREAQRHTAAALYAAGLLENLRAEGYLTEGSTEGECGAGLAPCRWRQTLTRTDLDGLFDVEVVIEDPRTKHPLGSLRTLLFEVPSTSRLTPAEREADRRSRAAQSPR